MVRMNPAIQWCLELLVDQEYHLYQRVLVNLEFLLVRMDQQIRLCLEPHLYQRALANLAILVDQEDLVEL